MTSTAEKATVILSIGFTRNQLRPASVSQVSTDIPRPDAIQYSSRSISNLDGRDGDFTSLLIRLGWWPVEVVVKCEMHRDKTDCAIPASAHRFVQASKVDLEGVRYEPIRAAVA